MAEETPSDNAPNDATGEPVDETTDTPAGKAAAHPAEAAFSSLEDAAGALRAAVGEGDGVDGVALPDFEPEPSAVAAAEAGLQMLGDVALRVKIELGRTRMYVEDVLRLNTDSVIELDKAAGDPVDIYVNDRHVARGEVLVLNENFCVRISEIIRAAASDEET
jgi:flagellar motor switch protein FliN/FliY